MFEKGRADTLQVTVVIPYPGTKLFEEGKEQGFLKTLEWDDCDMRRPVMTSSLPDGDVGEMAKKIYGLFLNPKYVTRKVMKIRSVEDLKFTFRGVRKVIGHIRDFG